MFSQVQHLFKVCHFSSWSGGARAIFSNHVYTAGKMHPMLNTALPTATLYQKKYLREVPVYLLPTLL